MFNKKVVDFESGTSCFYKIALNYAYFSWVSTVVDLLSATEHLLFKTHLTGCINGTQKSIYWAWAKDIIGCTEHAMSCSDLTIS